MTYVKFYTEDLLGTDLQKFDRIEHGQDDIVVTNDVILGMLKLINMELLKRSVCGLDFNKMATIKLLEAEVLMENKLNQ